MGYSLYMAGAVTKCSCFAFPAVVGHDPRHPVVTHREALLAQPTVHAWRPVGSIGALPDRLDLDSLYGNSSVSAASNSFIKYF